MVTAFCVAKVSALDGDKLGGVFGHIEAYLGVLNQREIVAEDTSVIYLSEIPLLDTGCAVEI